MTRDPALPYLACLQYRWRIAIMYAALTDWDREKRHQFTGENVPVAFIEHYPDGYQYQRRYFALPAFVLGIPLFSRVDRILEGPAGGWLLGVCVVALMLAIYLWAKLMYRQRQRMITRRLGRLVEALRDVDPNARKPVDQLTLEDLAVSLRFVEERMLRWQRLFMPNPRTDTQMFFAAIDRVFYLPRWRLSTNVDMANPSE